VGRIPIISRISYGVVTERTAIPQFNTSLDSLVLANNLVAGPDMYTNFKAHPGELGDGVHPNSASAISMNRPRAQTMTAAGLYSLTGAAGLQRAIVR
jgi:hypothetical protein